VAMLTDLSYSKLVTVDYKCPLNES